MSDKAKTDDQGSEKHVQKTPETVKNAGVITEHTHQDVHHQAIIVAQTNDQHPSGIQRAVHENFGITGELTARDKGKKHEQTTAEPQQSISRDELLDKASQGDGFARDLAKQLQDAKNPGEKGRVQDNADRLYHRGKYAEVTPGKQASNDNKSDSAMHLKALAKHNPALEPVSKLREYADKLPEGEQRKSLTALSREQAAELSPEMRAHYDQQHNAGTRPALTNTPEGWLHAFQRIAQLPMDKQLEILGSAFNAGIEHYKHDERERDLGRLIGTVEGAGQVATNLAKIADFSAYCITGDHERAGKMGKEFGDALGQTIVGGVRLWHAADDYLYNIGFSGDYARPVRDLAELGQKLDEHWRNVPPREQERLKSRFITEMAADGLIAASGVSAIKKAGAFTEILDAIAVEAKNLHTTGKKTVGAIRDTVDELLQPHAVTPDGMKIRVPREVAKDETSMLMSKADDMGESISKNSYRLDKVSGRLQRTDLGKLREPYHWPVMNEHFSDDVIRQSQDASCISAVGEMLSEGRLSERFLIEKIGTPGDLRELSQHLGEGWTSKTVKGTTLADLGKHGPWAAYMTEYEWTKFAKLPHVVLVDGRSAAGNVIIRDPLEGTKYEMTVTNFLKTWNSSAVYRSEAK
ncbi:MAG: hypothetical protein IT343_19145 [Candidatus Melainabacteria bacterium]|nr:hypothetical protein [Candidatus Melainabacteria bacterium]